MSELTITRNPDTGLLTAQLTPENRLLSDFLESEIQQDKALLAYFLGRAADQDSLPFEINGNAHGLNLTKERYTITSLQDEATFSGPLAELVGLLCQWQEFLNRT